MACRPLRLLHASDFHLERPLHGLAEAPGSLPDLCIEAPYRAARKVFDAALAEHVDLLVLAGDAIDARLTGPRGPMFLVEQFERLLERNITVVWIAGRADARVQRTEQFPLPANVHLIVDGPAQEIFHPGDGEPIARIVGRSFDPHDEQPVGDFRADDSGLFAIGVAYGAVTPETLKKQRIGYLALGGRHDRFTCSTGQYGAHYPGTPQGRRPAETGPHGCTIVHVDETGRTRTRFIATDVVRFVQERVVIDEPIRRGELTDLVLERLLETHAKAEQRDLLVSWNLSGAGLEAFSASRETIAAELLAELRRASSEIAASNTTAASSAEQAAASSTEQASDAWRPVVWNESLTLQPPAPRIPLDDESIAADLLRLVQQYEQDDDRRLDWNGLIPGCKDSDAIEEILRLESPSDRQAVLTEIARLGADLLSPGVSQRTTPDEVQS